jgi:hypothetical protein
MNGFALHRYKIEVTNDITESNIESIIWRKRRAAGGRGTEFFWMPENSGNSKPTLGGSWLDGVTGVERATRPSGGQLARLPPANWFSLNHDPHRPPLIFPLLSIQPIEANFRIDENH